MSNLTVNPESHTPAPRYLAVTALTYAMFFMFAMTTDAVGEIIKIAKGDMNLTNTQASAFHWATMTAIALSGILFGYFADKFGRKKTIIAGLALYGAASASFFMGTSFQLYFSLLFVSGLAIGIFKTAALALISDITTSTEEHTRTMNALEGFFGIGAIVGPLLVVSLHARGISWTYLYLFAAALCLIMIIWAAFTNYPETKTSSDEPVNLWKSFALMKNKYAMGFSMAIALYVAAEVSIFVWLPSYLDGYSGTQVATWMATYAVMVFFVFRALGRFLGIWILKHVKWTTVMMLFSGIIFACFAASAFFGQTVAAFLMPLSGLFMSMMYPTLNSKGISCFPKSKHGAVAGLILFFTAVSAAAIAPLMGFVADSFGGDMRYGFILATALAGLLFLGMIYNHLKNPAASALQHANITEYNLQG